MTTDTAAPPKEEFRLDLATIPECIREDVLRGLRRIQDALTSAPIVEACMRACAEAGLESVSITPRDGGMIGAWVSVWLKDQAQLVTLRRVLAKDGWTFEDKHDHPEDRRFVITLRRGIEDIGINCYLGSEGARCQYVQVGTKEVPVMELRCEGADK